MKAIWKRELGQFFLTPIGYVFIGIFLLISGIFFTVYNLRSGSSDLETLFSNIIYLFMVITPLLTMRLLSEEKHSRTDQLLFTSPLSVWEIVIGKYLAAVCVFVIALVFTVPFVIIISIYAIPYYGLIVSNYLGLFLIGCSYIAIGEWMSSLTESQITAAVLTYAVLILLQVFEIVASSIDIPGQKWISAIFSSCSLYHRYYVFTQGIVSVSNVFFFLSFAAFILVLTTLTVEKIKRKEG